MKNNIIVVFSSHLSEEENNRFIKHVESTIGVKHKIISYPNFNQFSLAEIYNQAIKEHGNPNSIFVMCHNDIIIKTNDWGKILLKHFNSSNYTVLGTAGTTLIPETGQWWGDFSKMYGSVEHTNGVQNWMSDYSDDFHGVKSVVHVDGLFIAIDHEKIEKKFNLNYGKFHFYDLTFCVDNYLEGCDIGVVSSIKILHKSVGETDKEWEVNRQKFVQEYELPIRHIPDNRLRVLICCYFFNNYTGSEVSNYELACALKKIGCDVTILAAVVGNPMLIKAKEKGIKVHSLKQPPNFRLNQENNFQFLKNEAEFDIMHINHKPIGEIVLQLYPYTPAVMHVRSEVIPVFEEPIVHPMIKRYISIRESITSYVKTFGITDDKITLIDNPFDCGRFNTDYTPIKNEKEVVLFVGTLDHLRRSLLFDLKQMTKEKNQELWIIGSNDGQYLQSLHDNHVKYLGIQPKVEDYIKKCDYTAGIFKGRTTIEGFLCGKKGWIYTVDKEGKIFKKELQDVPDNLEVYCADYSANKVYNLYEKVLEETWL